MFTKFKPWLAIAIPLLVVACAAKPGVVAVTKPIPVVHAPLGLAVHGYDAVAYFSDQQAIEGSPAFEQSWHGAKWRFVSAQHLAAFAADPERYAPQFGGYCAYAVSRGTTADGDPKQWAVVDQRLYLNNNAFAKSLWDRDRDASIAAGKINWPLMPKQPLSP